MAKRSGAEVKEKEENMKTEFEPEAKKLKAEAGNDYFLSSHFPKTVAKMTFKLTSLFRTVNEAIQEADQVEQDQRKDLFRRVHDYIATNSVKVCYGSLQMLSHSVTRTNNLVPS